MSRLTRYTLVALGAIALSVTSYCIGNATAQEPSPTDHPNEIRTVELAPMPALGAESTYMGLLSERARWDEALRWRALAQIAEAGASARSGDESQAGSSTTSPQPSGSGSCDGHVVPSYILQRESGCSYDAYNPTGCGGSGCIGLYQLDAKHFSNTCAGLDTSPAGQDECARRLSNNGTNLAPWAG